MKKLWLAILVLVVTAASYIHAADPVGPENPVHAELRTMRDGLLIAMNKGDIDAQLVYLHPNVVVTWHNAQVSRGRDGVRQYLAKNLQGSSKLVEKYAASLDVDELSILYGDTAIAFGSSHEHFKLRGGKAFDLDGRWTATLEKVDGKWLVASVHISDNLFDNPLLNRAKSALVWVGAVALILGTMGGWLLGRLRRA